MNRSTLKYLVMDVDGTLTDGKIYMSGSGEFMKAFNVRDGYGINNILRMLKIIPVIITGRKSDILLKRCEELGIKEVYQGVDDKIQKLKEITNDLSTVAYIGDDLNDLTCMKCIKFAHGIVGCPKDAANEVIEISDFVSSKNGGEGSVREFIEYICGLQS